MMTVYHTTYTLNAPEGERICAWECTPADTARLQVKNGPACQSRRAIADNRMENTIPQHRNDRSTNLSFGIYTFFYKKSRESDFFTRYFI